MPATPSHTRESLPCLPSPLISSCPVFLFLFTALRQAFLEETKCVSAMPKMIVTGYKELNLIYYFTAGETEVRLRLLLWGFCGVGLCEGFL